MCLSLLTFWWVLVLVWCEGREREEVVFWRICWREGSDVLGDDGWAGLDWTGLDWTDWLLFGLCRIGVMVVYMYVEYTS